MTVKRSGLNSTFTIVILSAAKNLYITLIVVILSAAKNLYITLIVVILSAAKNLYISIIVVILSAAKNLYINSNDRSFLSGLTLSINSSFLALFHPFKYFSLSIA